ncbi:MAG: hypothetical protein VKL59_15975 [Nostocaceae cyanobacterium]|nr:hypothetical protein [Nostocaceae cyanobacterium]
MGHGAWGMGHGAWGMGHWAWGMGHGEFHVLPITNYPLPSIIRVSVISVCAPLPITHYPLTNDQITSSRYRESR